MGSSWQAISELWGVTEVRCHTILLAARHKRAQPALTPAGNTGTLFTLPTLEGWKAELTWVLDYALAGNQTHDRLIENLTPKPLFHQDIHTVTHLHR